MFRVSSSVYSIRRTLVLITFLITVHRKTQYNQGLQRADNGNRTRLSSLGSWRSTDELYLHVNQYTTFFQKCKQFYENSGNSSAMMRPLISAVCFCLQLFFRSCIFLYRTGRTDFKLRLTVF